jgi:hypothetical protein
MTTSYFPRSAAVKATKLTADTSAFIITFNHGRIGYPFLVDNGKGIFVVIGDGKAIEIHVGDWVVESGNRTEVHADADFCESFCPVAS